MEIDVTNFFIKKNDTLPYLKITVIDRGCLDTKIPFNLSNVTGVTFSMIDECGNFKILNKDAEIISYSGGTLQYKWDVEDTDIKGIYNGEFRLSFSGDSIGIMSLPTINSIKIFVNNTINPY